MSRRPGTSQFHLHLSHPVDRARHWRTGGVSLGDRVHWPCHSSPGAAGSTTKASLQFPSPNCFLPRVGTRNSRLPLFCLSRVSARELPGVCWEESGGGGHGHGCLGPRPRGSQAGGGWGLIFAFPPDNLRPCEKHPHGCSLLQAVGMVRGHRVMVAQPALCPPTPHR